MISPNRVDQTRVISAVAINFKNGISYQSMEIKLCGMKRNIMKALR